MKHQMHVLDNKIKTSKDNNPLNLDVAIDCYKSAAANMLDALKKAKKTQNKTAIRFILSTYREVEKNRSKIVSGLMVEDYIKAIGALAERLSVQSARDRQKHQERLAAYAQKRKIDNNILI